MKQNIYIVTGHYGSGKTEFSINFALSLKQKNEKVFLVDLDIVNPFFRSNDARALLEQSGITVLAPAYAGTNVDIPVLPPEIMRIFEEKDAAIVLDVGGDDDGAVALGRYKQFFDKSGYTLFLVVNTRRPLTQTEDEIVQMKDDIEAASRLKVTALICDTNIADETTPDIVAEGYAVLEPISRKLNLPIAFVCATKAASCGLVSPLADKLFLIERRLPKI